MLIVQPLHGHIHTIDGTSDDSSMSPSCRQKGIELYTPEIFFFELYIGLTPSMD